MLPHVFLVCALITTVIQLGGFAAAFALQTEIFYDVLGGLNYLAITAVSIHSTDVWLSDSRKIATTVIFISSRGWLLLFLAWRAHERKGDGRFDGVINNFGTFLKFWAVQGLWVMLVSLPIIFINCSPVTSAVTSWDALFIAGFALGHIYEVVADVQKALWVKAGRQGGFCTVGLWNLSRHPNYFGEMLQWWAIWLLAFSSSSGVTDWLWWATAASPLFTMQLLVNVPETGLAQANGKNLKRYYDRFPESYTAYRASTSILLPMVGYQYVPMFLKRTIFFDLLRYEYRPQTKFAPSVAQTGTRTTQTSKAD